MAHRLGRPEQVAALTAYDRGFVPTVTLDLSAETVSLCIPIFELAADHAASRPIQALADLEPV